MKDYGKKFFSHLVVFFIFQIVSVSALLFSSDIKYIFAAYVTLIVAMALLIVVLWKIFSNVADERDQYQKLSSDNRRSVNCLQSFIASHCLLALNELSARNLASSVVEKYMHGVEDEENFRRVLSLLLVNSSIGKILHEIAVEKFKNICFLLEHEFRMGKHCNEDPVPEFELYEINLRFLLSYINQQLGSGFVDLEAGERKLATDSGV